MSIDRADGTLLDTLRADFGLISVKDGCSPQGQCGCCTVLINGAPRVACVTPLRRVQGREVQTLDGLANADEWDDAFCDAGGSQCGFCTPGIVVRLEGLRRKGADLADRGTVDSALAAHLCRCTGWQTIREAAAGFGVASSIERDLTAATRRAAIETRGPQVVEAGIALGRGGFSEDSVPSDALVAMPDSTGDWIVGDSIADVLAKSQKVQGRRTTRAMRHPVETAPGEWLHELRTTWVEPAYLEPDASWCAPGGEPTTPLANGGAFGAKTESVVPDVARRLANKNGRTVLALLPRESVVRLGPKRPPIAVGMDESGSGILRVVKTPGVEALVAEWATSLDLKLRVEQISTPGPPTSLALRAAIWAELSLVSAATHGVRKAVSPEGAVAEASVSEDTVHISVSCGEILDPVVLRSYCIGAAHMALGWIRSEGLMVDESGEVHDLTVRSFGVLRPHEMPQVEVTLSNDDGPPVNGSDAVFVAVATAAYASAGFPRSIPLSG